MCCRVLACLLADLIVFIVSDTFAGLSCLGLPAAVVVARLLGGLLCVHCLRAVLLLVVAVSDMYADLTAAMVLTPSRSK